MTALASLAAEFHAESTSPGRRMDLIRSTMDLLLEVDAGELEEFLASAIDAERDPIVRHEVVFVLGALVKFGFLSGERGLPVIIEHARTEQSTVVRHESVEALSNFPCAESLAALARALEDPNEDVRATALISLERISYHKDADDELRDQATAISCRSRI